MLMLPFFTFCNDDNTGTNPDEAKEQTLSAVVAQYVNYTVVATYKSLADESIELYGALVALKQNKTNANVQTATEKWIKARDYWELSEAFLYGAANDFGIDPHIDTWPLAKDELVSELKNNDHIEKMASEDSDGWVSNFLGYGLLGFHGIEYILFENGKPKDAAKITDKELIYAVAVGGDLRNQCFRLEASWAGLDNVTAEKRKKIEDLEMSVTINRGKYSYGQDMLNAGKAGSTKTSFVDACETIIEGCISIADEVGAMKIGMPHTGEDVNYIESPYSYNSKVDFIGNIRSIQNAYLGGADASKRGASLSDFIKTVDSTLDTQIKEAINNAIAKIEAIPYPFAKNFTSVQAGKAMEACNDLADILGEAKKALSK
jgi:uncharacterized iron-regulated protein